MGKKMINVLCAPPPPPCPWFLLIALKMVSVGWDVKWSPLSRIHVTTLLVRKDLHEPRVFEITSRVIEKKVFSTESFLHSQSTWRRHPRATWVASPLGVPRSLSWGERSPRARVWGCCIGRCHRNNHLLRPHSEGDETENWKSI